AADGKKGITIRHSGSMKGAIADAQTALGLAVQGFDQFRGAAETMARRPLAIRPYAESVLDQVLEHETVIADLLEKDREHARKENEKLAKRRAEILEDIIARYESDTNGIGGM